MATFVLVHGAWRGSWCWKRVRKALQRQGHEVFTPTLTGVGERSHLLAESVDLQTHTMDVLNLIQWEELTDFVLCGHSYGGMVVSGVADRVPHRIRSLVFLDAYIPENGESLVHFAPISGDQLIDGWKSRDLLPRRTLGRDWRAAGRPMWQIRSRRAPGSRLSTGSAGGGHARGPGGTGVFGFGEPVRYRRWLPLQLQWT